MPGQPLTLFWHDGGLLPTAEQFGGEIVKREGEDRVTQNGSLFIGEKGRLFDDYEKGGPTLLPREKMAEFKAPEKTLPRSQDHHQEWITAIEGGERAGSDFVEQVLRPDRDGPHRATRGARGSRQEDRVGRCHRHREKRSGRAAYVNKTYRPGWI